MSVRKLTVWHILAAGCSPARSLQTGKVLRRAAGMIWAIKRSKSPFGKHGSWWENVEEEMAGREMVENLQRCGESADLEEWWKYPVTKFNCCWHDPTFNCRTSCPKILERPKLWRIWRGEGILMEDREAVCGPGWLPDWWGITYVNTFLHLPEPCFTLPFLIDANVTASAFLLYTSRGERCSL